MSARHLITTLAATALIVTPALATDGADLPDRADILRLGSSAPKTLDQGASVGTFDASGRGVLVIRGRLTAYGRMTGVLTVRDIGGNAVVKINGIVQRGRLVRGVRVYSFGRGTRAFYARGRNIRVLASTGRKGGVHMSAFGRGAVWRMNGRGFFSVNSGPRHRWGTTRLPLQIKAG